MSSSNGSTLSKVAVGLGIAAAAALGVGVGLFAPRAANRRPREQQDQTPPIDTTAAISALLDRVEPVETGLGVVCRHITQLANAVANMESSLKKQTEDIEALKLQLTESQKKEVDAEIARLGALFVEMKHPLFNAPSELTH